LSAAKSTSDKKLLLYVVAAMLVLIVIVAVLKPQSAPDDPRPTTTNTSPRGAEAAYLMLKAMGRTTSRWKQPLADFNDAMDEAQAQRTTLVLAEPAFDALELDTLRKEIARFVQRGGRVLATGADGAALLPNADVKQAGLLATGICGTTPEGPGPLAQAGSVEMADPVQWSGTSPKVEVVQRCVTEAVVVRYTEGKGEVIWWSSAWPMDNGELKQDADLRLLLASLGDGRDVVFDESLHGGARTMWDAAKGLPLYWLSAQGILLIVLMVLSFSRRRGPLRMPVTLPRSSPVEFATSMGDLYEKAGATSAATEAARRRLLRVLSREAGVAQQSLQQGPEAIAEALQARLGGDWSRLSVDLQQCLEVQHGKVTQRSALALVRALHGDVNEVRARLKAPAVSDAGVLVG
jgi:hypothetical protein